MGMEDEEYVKILFRFENEIIEELPVETMWATVVDKEKGLYKIDNIPFYVPAIASDDLVFAEYDEAEMRLTYRHTIESSGNSTIQVFLDDKSIDVNTLRSKFDDFGCISEKVNERFFVMEIPFKINYKEIKDILEELENQNIIFYAEPCLSEKHSKEVYD